MLACTCAVGLAIPPFVVVACETYHPRLSQEVPGTLYGVTPKEWMTQSKITCIALIKYM